MLLRASRAAGQLTKEAIVGGILRAIGRHPMAALGTGAVGLTAAPEISKSLQRAKVGLHPQYLAAANAGMVPHVPQM
jgi:hypothetical protein